MRASASRLLTLARRTRRNPLGRVLQVYHDNKDIESETLQLKLDEAILKEQPAILARIAFIKIISMVAPLLGLLGTVIGMIVTFQAITLFGTGDPKDDGWWYITGADYYGARFDGSDPNGIVALNC